MVGTVPAESSELVEAGLTDFFKSSKTKNSITMLYSGVQLRFLNGDRFSGDSRFGMQVTVSVSHTDGQVSLSKDALKIDSSGPES